VNTEQDFSVYGDDLFGNPIEVPSRGKISDKFLVAPFSVLSARDGWWQDRKRAWLAYGIKGEIGRSAKSFNIHGWMEDKTEGSRAEGGGTSVFDPTLCELSYRWFCPAGGQIVDPFCGGSVRGIVAHLLGYRYWGCDLRAEQIQANEQQAADITPDNRPTWTCGDAMEMLDRAPEADLLFSCPPYGDLERYSDDPRDLSTMDYHAFLFALRRIVARCAAKLRKDRFACFVVGDFRDKRTGFCRNFVSDTVDCFKRCGLELYNEAVLITAVGSLPIRISQQFKASRKLGKTHQNVLVFVKGDPKKATALCGEVFAT
jgi:DNA modification methylase